ncbi:hypothetical protein ACE38V_11345 [Cytobacillus sp. Hz8]|uniref:hypothetical protein n=1 Tax=Cytobacillus sp. Hz8 TaxID=3347168 RepID=UPI0035DDBE61
MTKKKAIKVIAASAVAASSFAAVAAPHNADAASTSISTQVKNAKTTMRNAMVAYYNAPHYVKAAAMEAPIQKAKKAYEDTKAAVKKSKYSYNQRLAWISDLTKDYKHYVYNAINYQRGITQAYNAKLDILDLIAQGQAAVAAKDLAKAEETQAALSKALDDQAYNIKVKVVGTAPEKYVLEAFNAPLAKQAEDLAADVAALKEELAAPAVQSVSAINGAQLEVKFNKSIDKDSVIDADGTIKAGVLSVAKVDGLGTVSVTDAGSLATLSEDGKTLTVTAATGGAFNNLKYVATVNGDIVKTTEGKFVPKFVSNVLEATDAVAPTITNVEKLDASNVRVYFSEPLSNGGTWSFKYADGTTATVVPGILKISEGYVDLAIDPGVVSGKEITATVIGAKDFAGNLVNPNPNTLKITKGQLDGTKPTVTSITSLGLNKFEVKFSEEVQGFDGSDISIDGAAALNDVSAGTPATLEAGEAKVTRDTTDKTKYTVELGTTLSAGIHTVGLPVNAVSDLSGEQSAVFSKVLDFKADATAPKLVSSQIKKDENGLEYLHLTFDEAVNPGTVTALTATSVKDYVTTTGTIDLTGIAPVANTGNKEYKVKLADVEFDPTGAATADALATGAKFTLTLTGAFSDTSSVALGTSSIEFVRGTDTLTVAQTVTSVNKVVGTPSIVKVIFGQDVDGATATNPSNYNINGVVVEKAELRAGETNAVYLTLQANSNSLTGERNVSINGVKTKDGVAMSSAYAGTVNLDENVAPTFTAALVSGTSIKVTFNENVTDATDGITVSDLAVKYDGTELTETGTPQVEGIYSDAAMTTPIAAGDSVDTVYIKLASGVVSDLSKSLTVGTEGSNVKDTLGNVWATGTFTVSK